MANQLLRGIAGLGLLLMGSAVFAAGPCPDGNYNPQNRVCMCPGGGYVGPGQWCEGGGGQVEIIPVPKTWGAIAIDMSSAQKRASFRHSEKSQEDANKRAIEGCGLSTCRVAVTFRNSCGAVAAGGNGIWGGESTIMRTGHFRKQQRLVITKVLRTVSCGYLQSV